MVDAEVRAGAVMAEEPVWAVEEVVATALPELARTSSGVRPVFRAVPECSKVGPARINKPRLIR